MKEILGVVSALLTVFVFVTGYQSLRQVFGSRPPTSVSTEGQESAKAVDSARKLAFSSGIEVERGLLFNTAYLVEPTGRRKLLRSRGPILVSPDGARVVAVDGDGIRIVSANGSNAKGYQYHYRGSLGMAAQFRASSNPMFVTAMTLQVFVHFSAYDHRQDHPLEMEGFGFSGPGLYQFGFDTTNTLVSVNRVR